MLLPITVKMLDLTRILLHAVEKSQYSGLRTLDMSGASKVTVMPDNFLDRSWLIELDLNQLKHLRRIGDYFLYGCRNLKYLHWSELNNITRIGTNFMNQCDNLDSIDLRPLRNITEIPDYFMQNSAVKYGVLDFSALTKVAIIGRTFCIGVVCAMIDLSGMTALQSIGESFIQYTSADVIIFPQETRLTAIPDAFLERSNIGILELRQSLSRVRTIGSRFCYNIKVFELNLSSMTQLKSTGLKFIKAYEIQILTLPKCIMTELRSQTLGGKIRIIHGLDNFLRSITIIYNNVMNIDTSMSHLVLNMPVLRQIGNAFCYQIRGATHLITDAPNLQSIGYLFCSDASFEIVNLERSRLLSSASFNGSLCHAPENPSKCCKIHLPTCTFSSTEHGYVDRQIYLNWFVSGYRAARQNTSIWPKLNDPSTKC